MDHGTSPDSLENVKGRIITESSQSCPKEFEKKCKENCRIKEMNGSCSGKISHSSESLTTPVKSEEIPTTENHPTQTNTAIRTSSSFPCPQCEKTFKESRTLKLHLKIHNAEYPEQCLTCKKVFRTKWQLKQHQMDHGGERPYPCPECPFTCKTKQQLNEHRRKHSGEKAYSCPQCSTRFTYRNGLIKHTKLNRCPKKVVTPNGETVIKKRTRNNPRICLKTHEKPQKCNTVEDSKAAILVREKVKNIEVASGRFQLTPIVRNCEALSELCAATGLCPDEVQAWAANLPPGATVQVTRHFQQQQETAEKPRTFYIRTAKDIEGNITSCFSEESLETGGDYPVNQILESRQHPLSSNDSQVSTSSVQPLPSYFEAFAVDPHRMLLRESSPRQSEYCRNSQHIKTEPMNYDTQQYLDSHVSWMRSDMTNSPQNCSESSSSPSNESLASECSSNNFVEMPLHTTNCVVDKVEQQQEGAQMSNEQASSLQASTAMANLDLINQFNDHDFNSIKCIVEQTFKDGRDMMDIISTV